MQGQLSFPCAVLLGHPPNAGGSLTQPSLVCQLGCLPMQPQSAAELKGKEKTSPKRCREGGGCQLLLGDSRKLAEALELGEDKGKVGGAASAFSAPPSLGPQEGSCGKVCCAWCHRASWELHSGAIRDALQH